MLAYFIFILHPFDWRENIEPDTDMMIYDRNIRNLVFFFHFGSGMKVDVDLVLGLRLSCWGSWGLYTCYIVRNFNGTNSGLSSRTGNTNYQ